MAFPQWLAPLVGVLEASPVMSTIDPARHNASSLKQLQDRCYKFLDFIQNRGQSTNVYEQKRLVAGAKITLRNIITRMEKWHSKSLFELFVNQIELFAAIKDCHLEIDNSITRLQLLATLDDSAWQSEFKANIDRDRAKILCYLSDIENTQSIITMTNEKQSNDIKTIMAIMQHNLSGTANNNTEGLGTNLYYLQESIGRLLPKMHLQHGEARRVDLHPVKATGPIDIWEGLYLNKKKVAIKSLRTVRSTPQSLQRFVREAEVWNKVWEIDKERYILPIYGFCQTDGSFPYVVTPWAQNGTANTYVADNPNVDHRALIRGISAGINVLHTMSIVHGDLKGANIVMDAAGNPLLADFGFAKIVEDLGDPMSRGSGLIGTSARWLAPEWFENGKFTTATDVYAFGMTIFELMTHATWSAVRRWRRQATVPQRPLEEATIERGFDDHLWEVLQECWDNHDKRPNIRQLVQRL
ncbi:kinase-like protein [Paxillus ammoniavirescens]|nr:kinase-like protein [Paxillus ammoniavirescens]